MSEKDLAISLALNEAELGSNFSNIEKHIRTGGSLEFSDDDIVKLRRKIVDGELIKILGRGAPHYLRQDKIEDTIQAAARDCAEGIVSVVHEMAGVTKTFNGNAVVLCALFGSVTLDVILEARPNEADRDYVTKAFAHRAVRAMSEAHIFDADPEVISRILSSFSDIMNSVRLAQEQLAALESDEQDHAIAGLIFGDNLDALNSYNNHTPNLFIMEMAKFKSHLRQKGYGH